MSLPSSGPISFRDVNDELRYSSTNTIDINNSSVRFIGGRPSGQISFSDLRGKSYWKFDTGSSYHTPLKVSSNSMNWGIVECDLRFIMNTPGRLNIYVHRRRMRNDGSTGSQVANGASSAGSFRVYVNGTSVGYYSTTSTWRYITTWVRIGDQVRIVLGERNSRGKTLRFEFSGDLRFGNMSLHGTNRWRNYSANNNRRPISNITNSMLSPR